jgi:hypothetical protein
VSEEDIDRLITTVFEATGLNVPRDDPVIVAALFNAILLDRANKAALKRMDARNDEKIEAALTRLAGLAESQRKATEARADEARALYETAAATVKLKSPQSAPAIPVSDGMPSRRARVWVVGVAGCCIGLAAGAGLVLALGTHALTPEQQRLIANGHALDAIYPALPATLKAKLSDKAK